MKYLKYILAILITPVFVWGNSMGVSIDTSEIKMEEALKPGGVYTLSYLRVTNTGDQESGYVMDVINAEGQQELVPDPEWVEFTPQEFTLAPGESKNVRVELTLPFNAEAGEYFTYLEARVVRETGVGIASATKLIFDVGEGTFLQAFASRTLSLIDHYKPWTHIIIWVSVASVPLAIIKRNFEFKVNIKSAKKQGQKPFEFIPRN